MAGSKLFLTYLGGPTYLYVSAAGNNVIARPIIQQQVSPLILTPFTKSLYFYLAYFKDKHHTEQ